MLTPEDFGLPRHSLETVHGGKGPAEKAEILMNILKGEMRDDDPVLHFVLLNTAALITLSGITEADESAMGEGDDGLVIKERGPGGLRWKEGLRRARWCVRSGEALRQWEGFVDVTNDVRG
jgi:anthranilate phosphoribosyltransferase